MEFKKFRYILNIEYNMSFEIYSEQFYKESDKKIEKVENENSDLPFLSKEEYAKQQKIIEDFLKKYKQFRIIVIMDDNTIFNDFYLPIICCI